MKKWYINKHPLQHIPVAAEEAPNDPALQLVRVFQKNTIQHFQFSTQPTCNVGPLAFAVFPHSLLIHCALVQLPQLTT